MLNETSKPNWVRSYLGSGCLLKIPRLIGFQGHITQGSLSPLFSLPLRKSSASLPDSRDHSSTRADVEFSWKIFFLFTLRVSLLILCTFKTQEG